jgi:glycosidase
LIHGVILTAGGIPLIYLGDEIGTLNDYSYLEDPAHARDSRWVHRPRAEWEKYDNRKDPHTIEGRIYQNLQKLIALRRDHDAFSGGELEIIWTGNDHILGFHRVHKESHAFVFANFSEAQQTVPRQALERYTRELRQRLHSTSSLTPGEDLILEPLDFLVFC